jgi:cell division protein FtsQ
MPLEMPDPDADESLRPGGARVGGSTFGRERFQEPSGPWWRPASTVGRVFLGLGVLIVLGGSIAGVLGLKTYLGRDARFRITGAGNIEATGLTQVSRAEMLPVFGEDIGRNIFFVPLNERRKQLEAIPWVERATVMRLLPDQIRVSLVERQPVAFVRNGQQIGLVDANGVLLTMPAAMMAQHHYSFPVVTGIEPTDPLPMRRTKMAVYGRLLAELDANNQQLSQQISEIDLTDPQDARVLMPEQGMDILGHFGDDRFLERYQRYKAHIAEWRAQYPKLAAVDLRYDSQVVLEMTPGTNAVQATVTGDALSESKSDASLSTTAAKPSASTKADASAAPEPVKPQATKPAATPKPTKAALTQSKNKQPSAKQASVSKSKTPPHKAATAEALATKQREARAKAAKEKAAHEKAAKEKKHAAPQQAALTANPGKQKPSPSTRAVPSAAPGQ